MLVHSRLCLASGGNYMRNVHNLRTSSKLEKSPGKFTRSQTRQTRCTNVCQDVVTMSGRWQLARKDSLTIKLTRKELSKTGCQEQISVVQTENKIKSHPDKIKTTKMIPNKAQTSMRKLLHGAYRQLVSKANLSKGNSSVGRGTCFLWFISVFYHLAPVNVQL